MAATSLHFQSVCELASDYSLLISMYDPQLTFDGNLQLIIKELLLLSRNIH